MQSAGESFITSVPAGTLVVLHLWVVASHVASTQALGGVGQSLGEVQHAGDPPPQSPMPPVPAGEVAHPDADAKRSPNATASHSKNLVPAVVEANLPGLEDRRGPAHPVGSRKSAFTMSSLSRW
jgi:hypothetical protein